MGEIGPEWHLLHVVQRPPGRKTKDPFDANRNDAAKKAMANQRKANPEVATMVVVDRAGRGKFNLIDLLGHRWPGVSCTDPSLAGMLKAGDAVMVRFDRTKANIPYIRDIAPIGSVPQKAPDNPPEPPVPPPVFAAGMWLQHGGFWWQPRHNRESIPRFDLIPPLQPSYTDEVMAVWFEASTGNTIIALKHTGIDYASPWNIKRNGTLFINKPSGGPPPAAVPACFIETVGYTITESFDPSGGQLDPGEHDGFALIDVDFSADTWTATYKEKLTNVTVNYTRPDEIPDAARKTMPFKGLVLIPDGGHQNVSVLSPHFEVEGSNIRVDEASDVINFVAEGEESGNQYQREGIFFTLEHLPRGGETPVLYDYVTPPEYDGLFWNDLVIEQIADTTFGAKVLLNGSRWLHFYYSYRDFPEGNTDSVTVSDPEVPIIVRPRETVWVDAISDSIEAPTYEITQINSISINGTGHSPDEIATFSGDELIISAPLSAGDTVSWDLDGYSLINTDQIFTTVDDQFEFEMDHENIFIVNFLAQGITGPDEGDTQNYSKLCHPAVGTNVVTIYMFWAAGVHVEVKYHYDVVTGDYYRTAEMRVYEVGGNFSGQRVLKTPIPEYILNPKIGRNASDDPNQRYVDEALGLYRDGQLFIEPNTKSYTIASPSGLIWRSRALLTEPAPDLAEPKVHYTFTPWPEESESTDWYNTNPNYDEGNPAPETKIKNREDKWMGFCCGGPYGLQGSWNRYGGVLGDTSQVIRLWKRSTLTFTWNNHKNVELEKLLPPDISTDGQARIQGMGMTDFYNRANSSGDFGTGGIGSRQLMPGKWPLSKDYKAWIVAAPFVVENFQADLDNPFGHDPNDRGWKDAGITFSAIDSETGEVLSQYTIRPSNVKEDALPVFANPQRDLEVLMQANNDSLDESIDKYYNYNPYYYGSNPEHELKPPFDGQNTVICSGLWATVPFDSGYIYRLYTRITGIANEIERNLGYPGIPMFTGVSYSSNVTTPSLFNSCVRWQSYQNPDTNGELNSHGEPNISMDESGNIYFILAMPCWQRWQDVFAGGSGSTVVQRTYTQVFPGAESTQSFWRVAVFFNGNLCDGNVEAYFNGNPTGHNYPGFDSGFLVPYTYENVYIPGTFSHYVEGTENPDTGYPGVPVYTYPSGTIEVRWGQVTVDGYTEFLVPAGPFEYPSFSGYQSTPMPIRGMAISNSDSDWSREYHVTVKPYLFKLHFDSESGILTEKWRKDLSDYSNFPENTYTRFGENFETLPLANIQEATNDWAIACGRYIFVIKSGVYVNPNGTVSSDFLIRKSVLEIYLNQDGSAPDLFKTLDIPNTTESINTAFYSVVFATADVDDVGREHLFMRMSNNRATSVLMPLDSGEDPDVQNQLQHSTSGQPDFPVDRYESNTLARAARTWFWLDNDNNVKKHTIPEE